MDRRLSRLAAAVLQPGFVGTAMPDWVRRSLADGLGAVTLYARNIVDSEQVAALTAQLRAESPAVVVSIDEEAGDVTRLEAHTGSSRPGNLALGAADDPELTAAVARHLGRDLANLGINLNFAPDADVNSNPNNPVIGSRAFGADPVLVARHTAAWVEGLQSTGVAACAKHFPGHGDTAVDSHHDVPVIPAGRDALYECELVPFRAAIDAGVRAIMTGHLVVPAIDPVLPATLSPAILTGLMREEMGFRGLIVTDAIEMQAVARRYGLAGATVAAIAAGADAICVGGEHADEAVALHLRDAIVAAVKDGTLPEHRLVESAARVAELAAWSRRVAAVPHTNGHPGLGAARRALRVTAPAVVPWPLTVPAHVVELSPPTNMAIAPETPWGVAAPLTALQPATTTARYDHENLTAGTRETTVRGIVAAAAGRPIVVAVRDAHRHDWIVDALDALLAARPDAIVVEMGVPARTYGDAFIASHGASAACAQAVAELLTGAISPVALAPS